MKNFVMALVILAVSGCIPAAVPQTNRCQQAWNDVWLPAKQGDLKARFRLAGMLMFHDFVPPGAGGDKKSRQQLYMAMEVHALGYSDGSAFSKQVPMILAGMYGESRNPQTEAFFTCLEQRPSQECAKTGVALKVVPPFELLAGEIDAAATMGEQPRCPAPPPHGRPARK